MNVTNLGPRRRGTAIALTALVALAATACGSTVRNAHQILGQRAQGGYAGSTITAPTSTEPGGTVPGTPETSVEPTSPSGSTPGGMVTTGTGTGDGTSSGTATPTKTSAPTTRPAATPKVYKGRAQLSPVEIGIVYSGDLGAFAKLFGGSVDAGNLTGYANAVLAYINGHGGFAGHVVRPVYYSIPLTSTQPYSTTMAAICSSWTQDHHVVAGIEVGFSIPNDLAQCLSAKHIPLISGGGYLHDATTYRQIPYLISPYEGSTDEVMRALVSRMLSTHWVNAKSRVGVLLGTNEAAAVRAYNNVVKPMLKGHVASITTYGVLYPPSTQAAVATAQVVSNDQLHARANGVTHMIFLAPGAQGSFIDDAYQQKWFPKYALTSYDGPWALASAHDKETLAALSGSLGIGWQPTSDVGTYGSNVFTNATTKLCKAIYRPSGQLTSNVRDFAGFQYCDGLLFVQAAANASPSTKADGPAILAGFNALGTSHPSAVTFRADLNPQHHSGAGAFRPLSFIPSCRCFRYAGGVTNF